MSDNTKKPPTTINPDDFDKTLLDVDIRKLDEEDMDKTQLIGRKKNPASSSEAAPVEVSAPVPASVKITEKPISASVAKANVQKKAPTEEKSQFNFKDLLPSFLLCFIFSLFYVSLLIDALAHASPLRFFLSIGFILNILFVAFCFLRKISLKNAAYFSASLLLLTFSFSSYQYGSLDSLVLTSFKKTPAFFFNFIFLISIVYIEMVLLRSKTLSKVLKAVFSLFLFYVFAGILENLLYAPWIFSSFWNLEDNLKGSSFLPFPFYLKPLAFYFYLILPLLFLIQLLKLLRSRNEILTSFFKVLFFFNLMLLSQVILVKNSYPSLLGLLGFSKESTGMGFVYDQNKSSIQIQSANYSKLKNNDLISQQIIAASLLSNEASATNSLKKINLLLRNEAGRQIPFENKKDLQVLDQNSLIPNFKLTSLLKKSSDPKSIFFLLASSPSLTPYATNLKDALATLNSSLNNKEKIFLRQTNEARGSWLSSGKLNALNLQAPVAANIRLPALYDTWIKSIKSSKVDKLSFLLAAPDFVVSEEEASALVTLLKKQKITLLSFCLENECSSSLKGLAEQTGGKSFVLASKQEWASVFLSAYSQVFPDYQLSYNFQGSEIDFQILSPANEALLTENSSLDLRLNTPLAAGSKVTLLTQDKLLQEQVIASDQNIKINLNLAQFPKGKNTYKVIVTDIQGKQSAKDIILNVPDVKKFLFVRPLEGDTVSGQLNLEAFIHPVLQPLVSKVEFFLEEQKIGEALSEPYLITWDSAAQSGSRVFKTLLSLTDGSTLQDQAKVNFAPSISTKILSPALGEYLNLLTEIEAEVYHPLSETIEKVEFLQDGILLSALTQAPYKYLWDNSSLLPGKHYLQARAYSKLGSSTDSVSVNIGSGTLSVSAADVSSANTGLSPDYFEWVIDASKTMASGIGGSKKIDWVKNALGEILPKISPDSKHAFRWMGAQNPSSFQNCKDTQLYSSFKPLELAKLPNQWSSLEAKGIAPLAYTLEKIRSDLKGTSGSRVVVLFTDAYENCGGDPVLEMERWKKDNLNVKLYIIGLDLEGSRDESELKRIASIVGGEYYSVTHPQELSKTLENVIKVSYKVLDYKDKEVAQKPVGSEAIVLRTGEYRVKVDLEPPLVMEKVLLLNGLEKKLFLKKEGTQFKLSE